MQFEATVTLNRRKPKNNTNQVNQKVYDLLNKALNLLKSQTESTGVVDGLDELIEETEQLNDNAPELG